MQNTTAAILTCLPRLAPPIHKAALMILTKHAKSQFVKTEDGTPRLIIRPWIARGLDVSCVDIAGKDRNRASINNGGKTLQRPIQIHLGWP